MRRVRAPVSAGVSYPDLLMALPEAVRLLWLAFAKGNSGAAVALADLYRRGEGVPQNCEQTRVLLDAAAKKGNTEAKKELVSLEKEMTPQQLADARAKAQKCVSSKYELCD